MAYEVEAIAESNVAIPNQSTIQFREERVVTPYQPRGRSKPVVAETTPAVGQQNIDSGSKETKTPTAESVTLSPAAAALARKEQKFRRQEQELKAKDAALEVERKEVADLKSLKQKLASRDYSGIENLIKYDEYTNYLIDKAAGSDPQVEELKNLKTEIEDLKKNQKADTDKRFEAAVDQRRKAVVELVAKDPAYSAIRKAKAEEHVVQHILDTWEHDNVDLPPEQAAKEVEEILRERAEKWAGILKNDEPEPVVDPKKLPPLKPGAKTLTNNLTVTGDIKTPAKSLQGMSDSERWAEARRRAMEKLKG